MPIVIKKTSGFGLIEVLIVMLLIATTLFGLTKLATSTFRSTNYTNNQEQLEVAKQFIIDRIYANLKLINGTRSAAHYDESGFSSDSSVSSDCSSGTSCTQDQQALYDLYLWKQYLLSLKINSLRGIVCSDNDTPGIPTITNPNCNPSGNRVYVKLVWQNLVTDKESNLATLKNYLIVPIVTGTEVAMFSAWTATSSTTPVPTPIPINQLPINLGQCYSGNCSNTIITGACNSSVACDSSIIYGACNSQTSCNNSIIFGSCNVFGASCNNSIILGGDCNSSSCTNSFIDGSCNSGGNCSGSLVTGNCWGGNCTNAIIYGSCSGDCSGSIVYGSCWGTGCSNGKSTTTTNSLSQSLTISGSKNNLTISGFTPVDYSGFITVSSISTGSCTNGGTCTSSAIDGQCGNNSTCSSSFVNGSCNNNGTCNNSYINGGCSNNGVCDNSVIIGNCGNNATCKNSVIYGSCSNNADCSGATCRNPYTGANQAC